VSIARKDGDDFYSTDSHVGFCLRISRLTFLWDAVTFFVMRIARLDIVLQATEEVRLPVYKGAVLRGAFGSAFRGVACPFPGRECSGCLLRQQCVYSLVFETPRPENSAVMRKYETVPHPFLIEPPAGNAERPSGAYEKLAAGEKLEFVLVLLGPAVGYLPYFIYAFEEMAGRGLGPGRGKLELVAAEQSGRVFYDGSSKSLKSPIETELLRLDQPRNRCSEMTIRLLTPLRIVREGRIAQSLDFHVLLRSLIRRIGLLSYFYSERPWEIDYRGLIARAEKVKTLNCNLRAFAWQRYSTRQEKLIDMDGLIGDATYAGDLSPFLPFLRIGEKVHIGKGTVFGLGKYEMELQ